jgi:dATP pyrophosphohydrolase
MSAVPSHAFTPERSGMYLAPAAPASLLPLQEAAQRDALAWREVDLAGVRDKDALIAAFARALGFPAGFGGNWDALADSLQDLQWLRAPGYVIHVKHAGEFARAAAGDWALALDILGGAVNYWRERGQVFVVLMDEGASLRPYGAAVPYKLPVSVLVVVHTPAHDVLLLERADRPGFWQSVTGSRHEGESLAQTAAREVREETGLDVAAHRLTEWGRQNRYEIYPRWRHRYAPGVTHNTEYVFDLEVPAGVAIRLAPREHTRYQWLPWQEAARKAFSSSNADAIRELPGRQAPGVG